MKEKTPDKKALVRSSFFPSATRSPATFTGRNISMILFFAAFLDYIGKAAAETSKFFRIDSSLYGVIGQIPTTNRGEAVEGLYNALVKGIEQYPNATASVLKPDQIAEFWAESLCSGTVGVGRAIFSKVVKGFEEYMKDYANKQWPTYDSQCDDIKQAERNLVIEILVPIFGIGTLIAVCVAAILFFNGYANKCHLPKRQPKPAPQLPTSTADKRGTDVDDVPDDIEKLLEGEITTADSSLLKGFTEPQYGTYGK